MNFIAYLTASSHQAIFYSFFILCCYLFTFSNEMKQPVWFLFSRTRGAAMDSGPPGQHFLSRKFLGGVRRQRILNAGAEGGARSMTGRAGQLIVNMTKTGFYYSYFLNE